MFLKSFPILELLQDCYDPAPTLGFLGDLQADLGVRFPREYVEFILEFNGGWFVRPVMFYVPDIPHLSEGAGINGFIGACRDDGSGDLRWYAETLRNRIPDECLAIASCNSMDLVMLILDGEESEFGKVLFWDGTEEGEGDNTWCLADSFQEFLGLLQYDTDYDFEDVETLPLFNAIEHGKLRVVEEFLARGGDIESRNAGGRTLLAAAADHRWPRIVRFLLDRGADPNARDQRGKTPLHHAAESSLDAVKLLLAAGADPNVRDKEGKGVLADWSFRADRLLRAHGAVE